MTDNSLIPVASGNETFANEDITSVKYPTPKIAWGPTGIANRVDVASGKALPAQIRSATGLIPIGEPTDAKSTATDTTSVTAISIWKQISASVQALNTAIGSTLWDLGISTGGSRTQRVAIDTAQMGSLGQTTMPSSVSVAPASNWMPVGSAVPSSAPYQGANAITALPSAATAGNLVGVASDKFGRQIVQPITVRDLTGTQTTTISASTSETTIVTAIASTFNDIVMLIVSNTSASTTTRIDFRDTTGGSVLFSLTSIGGQPPVGFCPAVAIPQTSVNTNWTAQCSASTTDVRIYAVYAKNK